MDGLGRGHRGAEVPGGEGAHVTGEGIHVEGIGGAREVEVVIDAELLALSKEKIGDVMFVPSDENVCIGDISVVNPAADTYVVVGTIRRSSPAKQETLAFHSLISSGSYSCRFVQINTFSKN